VVDDGRYPEVGVVRRVGPRHEGTIRTRHGAHLGVDTRVVGEGEHQESPANVRGNERALDEPWCTRALRPSVLRRVGERGAYRRGDPGRDHGQPRARGEKWRNTARRHGTGADDEHGAAHEAQLDRVRAWRAHVGLT
jgi:hypothetical protein